MFSELNTGRSSIAKPSVFTARRKHCALQWNLAKLKPFDLKWRKVRNDQL